MMFLCFSVYPLVYGLSVHCLGGDWLSVLDSIIVLACAWGGSACGTRSQQQKTHRIQTKHLIAVAMDATLREDSKATTRSKRRLQADEDTPSPARAIRRHYNNFAICGHRRRTDRRTLPPHSLWCRVSLSW
jgi:hypothetical protein